MYPYTASSLKEQKHQKMEDYLRAAGIYHISHMLAFSMTDNSTMLKICKLPGGPTLTFKVLKFTLAQYVPLNKSYSDLVSERTLRKMYTNAPLLVMSGFGKEDDKGTETARIISVMLQSIFPPINVNSISLPQCKRVVLFSLTKGEAVEGHPAPLQIEFRHYEIATRQRNVNKAVRTFMVDTYIT